MLTKFLKEARSCLRTTISSFFMSWGCFELLGGVIFEETLGRVWNSCTDTLFTFMRVEIKIWGVLFAFGKHALLLGFSPYNFELAWILILFIDVDNGTVTLSFPLSLLFGLWLGDFEVKSLSFSKVLSGITSFFAGRW